MLSKVRLPVSPALASLAPENTGRDLSLLMRGKVVREVASRGSPAAAAAMLAAHLDPFSGAGHLKKGCWSVINQTFATP
jgi:hypothetical protein